MEGYVIRLSNIVFSCPDIVLFEITDQIKKLRSIYEKNRLLSVLCGFLLYDRFRTFAISLLNLIVIKVLMHLWDFGASWSYHEAQLLRRKDFHFSKGIYG